MKKTVCVVALFSASLGGAPARTAVTEEARVRASVMKTISLFEKAGADWKIPCISCHHQGAIMMALESARVHGLAVNETALQAHAAKTLKQMSGYEFLVHMPVDTFAFGYALAAAHAAGISPNLATTIAAKHIAGFQRPDGSWPAADARPPHSYSSFAATALAARALALYAPPQLSALRAKDFARARRWLNATQPLSTEDRAFRLLGLKTAPIARAR